MMMQYFWVHSMVVLDPVHDHDDNATAVSVVVTWEIGVWQRDADDVVVS